MPEISAQEWDNFLHATPQAHILQTRQWGDLKSRFGWQAVRVVSALPASGGSGRTGAQILFRPLPLGFSIGYIPKGPLNQAGSAGHTAEWESLWPEIDAVCRDRRAAFLKVEPDVYESNAEGNPVMSRKIAPPGFLPGEHAIQPARTLLVNIQGEEDEILNRMKQKTRYNIRLAHRKGILVSTSSDLEAFYRLMLVTADRDRFPVHSQAYYQSAYDLFHPEGACELFQAEYAGLPVACLMVFARGSRAWYFYGASSDVHRELMPAYLLQWEAIRWARRRGCQVYDLWGVPDQEMDILEQQFAHRSDGLWGVYRFKRGFGGQLHRSPGPWDRVYQPFLYRLYRLRMRMNASRPEVVA